uniref:DUF2911 domain-containing protein n=2 Tax=Gelidibacter sp. TaxID=2018083 RepID=UPI0040495041
MKKISIVSTLSLAFIMLFSMQVNAQKFSDLDKSPMDAATFPGNYKVANKVIKVIYSRPQLNGRDVSKLAPNGDVWRTGANEATEIIFYKDVTIGGKKIKAGTYSLFTIPENDEWTILINTDINVWGAYTYNDAKTVAKITVPVTQDKTSLDAFSIVFEENKNGADMFMGWGTLRVKVPIQF